MRGDWTIKVTTISNTKNFLIYLMCFVVGTMVFTMLKLVVLGLILSGLVTGFLYWYQTRNNPGAIKYYFEYVLTPNTLSGNYCDRELSLADATKSKESPN